VDRLIKAFSKMKESDLGLVCVGKGHPIGHVLESELPILYSMAEMFVFPSLYEGFGLPPLEAMSCGCPTVVSNAASIPEVCGNASVYFDPRQEDEMAEMMMKVASDKVLKKLLIQKGLERVKTFSWEQAAARHVQLFEEIMHA
jgi:glycosyltransferase involved in cell wall biosynthesis